MTKDWDNPRPPRPNTGDEVWNSALNAAAKLLSGGYTYIRRPIDHKSMTSQIEIVRGNKKVKGDFEDATHCNADEMAIAAILSLKRRT